ncbi:SDR family NAD(P)-dependent oxidoreductase [Aquabacterium sp.]|uniref:SDR family NAD(P)-dependent oxidoreductase n=1 Tax=Aquabacterium sp. TaxID=1872578 RepID=UPI0019A2AF00|nr:SDR family NAD(P)-dependent oxidoreductase [Aquabacterium sp.]MBC7701055.1 SDR family NAD(P)-dependent oxidoreductase [Aquabacterium sp.]
MSAAQSTGRLHGQLALVTGASAGIGRATALALAREGAGIVATGRRQAELDGLAQECAALGVPVQVLAGDLNDAAFAQQLAAAAAGVDIFINNAGVLTYAPLLELTQQQVDDMFQTNVLASIRIASWWRPTWSGEARGTS